MSTKTENFLTQLLDYGLAFKLEPGTRVPDSWQIVDNIIHGNYNRSQNLGYTWSRSTPISEKVEEFDHWAVTTESGSKYVLYFDKEIKS